MMNLPNRMTIIRILLVPAFFIIMAYHSLAKDWLRFVALGIFSLAASTDALDGFLARTKNEKTKLGTYLDPLADKILLSVSFVLLSTTESLPCRLPLWFPVVVISRDIILLLGSVLILVITGDLKIRPSLMGKMTTVFQTGTVIFTLLDLPFTFLRIVWTVTLILTILSFSGYVVEGSKTFEEHRV